MRRSQGPLHAARARRGIALISVISVLVLLMIVATPFLLSMRDSARRGERFLYDERAEAEAESLFERVRAHLTGGVEHLERRRLDILGPGGSASGAKRPPNDCTPTADTPDELQLPADMLAEFNQTVAKEHRVWDVKIQDAQAKFNLNSCSIGVLANILGRGELADDITSSDDRMNIGPSLPLPLKNGAVRVGSEAVTYETYDDKGGVITGCKRGVGSAALEHKKGTLVVNESVVQIATRPFRWAPGRWTRYTNVYEARSISEMGVAAIRPEDFDRLRRYVTAWSDNVVGDGWSNPQLVRNSLTAGANSDLSVQVKNLRYFGPGTMVRITDGLNEDYAVVTEVQGNKTITLAGNLAHDYVADRTRIYSLARAAVNVNTASADTLSVLFDGLALDGKSSRVSKQVAIALANFLKEWKNDTVPDDPNPEIGVYRTWQDFVKALEAARDRQSILSADDFEAILRNAMNPCDARLSYSTVPICFRSFDVYEAVATAAMLGPQGQELARRELRRVFEVSSGRSSTFVLESQADFQEQIRIARDAKWFVSYPVNVNAYYDGGNEPASEYQAFANKSRFPDTDRSISTGHLQFRPGAFRKVGVNDLYIHFDEQDIPDGLDLSQQPLELSVDGPYSAADKKMNLTKFVSIPGLSDKVEVGMTPFSASFWYRPSWAADATEHIIFDYGLDEPFMNRVSLRYDPARNALVLGVADATREQRAAEIEYKLSDNQVVFEQEQWYHIACTVYGCTPEMMELFVDGEQVGRALYQTKLTAGLPPTGEITSIEVEDANGFPDSGVLLLHAREGIELIEYSQRSERSFQVSRRKARTLNKVLDTNQEQPRTHVAGESVVLYGFAAPLLTDVRKGGATLRANLGPWRVFRATGSDMATIVLAGQPPVSLPPLPGIAYIQGYDNEITLTEWETGNPSDSATLDDLGATGVEGVAALVSLVTTFDDSDDKIDVTGGSSSGQNSDTVGGVDIVRYRVGDYDSGSGRKVTLLTTQQGRGMALRHWDSSVWVTQATGGGRFFPNYDYGNAGSIMGDRTNTGTNGTLTAFVPIGILAAGTSADYLDPVDAEPQLWINGNPQPAYAQIDSEWFAYDVFDNQTFSPNIAFYRDITLDNLAALFAMGQTDRDAAKRTPSQMPSSGTGGGSGTGSNTEPDLAQDGNVEATAPPRPATGTVVGNQVAPPANWNMDQIAARVAFRSWEDRTTLQIRRVANTIARDHSVNAQIVPCFATISGNDWDQTVMGRFAYGGFNDLMTLRDARGSDEQIRLQWGWGNWVAPIQPTAQVWRWDRVQEKADLRRFPSQVWTRGLKFPSREMPDQQLTANVEKLRFGRRFDDAGGTTPGTVDELAFPQAQSPPDDRRDWVFLGQVPNQLVNPATGGQQSAAPLTFAGIDETTDEIPVYMPYWDPGTRSVIVSGLPIPTEVFRSDGGVVRIDDELILYTSVDPAAGRITGCIRGRFGTTARAHDYGAMVFSVETFPTSILMSDADEQTASFTLSDATDFPDDGYLRIDDGLEIIGYTEVQGNQLSGPLGRIDPTIKPGQNPDEGALAAGGLFRGRFGTIPSAYSQGAVVLAMPFRHYDRYAERADDPENSYAQFSWTKENAIWKRITWEETPVKNVEVMALVRFSGGPAWDSERIVKVGQETLPKEGRSGWLYQINDQTAENLLNVEADRCEVRMLVRFDKGAYDRTVTPRPNEWKKTPWIKKVVVEYVAPSSVLSQE